MSSLMRHMGGFKCDFCYLRDLSNWGSVTGDRDKRKSICLEKWGSPVIIFTRLLLILSLLVAGLVSVDSALECFNLGLSKGYVVLLTV